LDCFSYFSAEFLGVNFAVPHNAGDYVQIELSYEAIKDSLIIPDLFYGDSLFKTGG
jgi:hypothetical protein